jgi:predicted metal-dependent hydrolase
MSNYDPHPEAEDCLGGLHPRAIEGFALFNAGEYWKAHEALEEAWLAETGQVRHLYRGILQVAVTYYHLRQKNYAGAAKVYRRSQRWLRPFPPVCRGIDIAGLQDDLSRAMDEAHRLGPERLAEFDPALLRPIRWTA